MLPGKPAGQPKSPAQPGKGMAMSGGMTAEPSSEELQTAAMDVLDKMSQTFGQQGLDFEDTVKKWLSGKSVKPVAKPIPRPPSGGGMPGNMGMMGM